jgi:hypothetical protein
MSAPKPIPALPAEQLLGAIAGRYAINADTGCWNWTGPTNGCERGRVYIDGETFYAYRVSYTAHVGPIPDGAQINHHCDNPACINPEHLYAGTHLDNMRDAVERGRLKLPPVRRGPENHHALLTDAQAAEIARRYAAGEATQAQLSAEYGVAVSSIGRIVRGQNGYTVDVITWRGRGRKAHIQPCGSRAGYFTHRRRGEPICDPCREANNAYLSEYKRQRRVAGMGDAA